MDDIVILSGARTAVTGEIEGLVTARAGFADQVGQPLRVHLA